VVAKRGKCKFLVLGFKSETGRDLAAAGHRPQLTEYNGRLAAVLTTQGVKLPAMNFLAICIEAKGDQDPAGSLTLDGDHIARYAQDYWTVANNPQLGARAPVATTSPAATASVVSVSA
jgi:hypothetical protein